MKLAAALWLLLCAIPAAAADNGWTLALSWEPGFCATAARGAECEAPRPALVLHGLWPEGTDCGRERERRRWCELPPLPLSAQTAAALRRVMPGMEACLERHEWVQHGRCSGLPADAYFARAAQLAADADALKIGAALRDHAGGTITAAALRAALAADFGADAEGALQPICVSRAGEPHLVEIRLSLAAATERLLPHGGGLSGGAHASARCPEQRPFVVDP